MKKTVLNGIDRIHQYRHLFEEKRVGLITNPTGVNKNLVPTADILFDMGVLVCMFSPEHGVRGNAQAGKHIESYTDEKTGIPVYSLYGDKPHIPKEAMDSIDIVAFDIQDIGARYYTYMYTLSYAMEDCAAAEKTIVVFDRVNPVGGESPQGNILDPAFSSFVGRYPLAARHNLTIGEYALYINQTQNIGCDLEIIPLSGWSRSDHYDDTDLLWIPPSPNIPTADTALCYIGNCLFEGTNLSEGRGTTRPFECIGAPWLDGEKVAEQFNQMGLSGVKARGCWFTPVFSKHAGVPCGGVFFHITDKRAYRPFESALYMLDIIRRTHAEFAFTPFIDLLFGTDVIRREGFDTEKYLRSLSLTQYGQDISKYYLY